MKNIVFILVILLSTINVYSEEPPESKCKWIYDQSMTALFVGDYNIPSGVAVVLTTPVYGELFVELKTIQGKMMYAMLLSSKLAEKSVDIYFCDDLIYVNQIHRVSIK